MFKRLLLITAAALGLYAQEPAQEPQLPKAAVMPLKGAFSGHLVDQGDTLYQLVTKQFFKMKRFDLIERAQLQMVLGESKFQNSGLVDEAGAVELGKQLGAKFIVLGSWTGNLNIQKGGYQTQHGWQETTSYTGQLNLNVRMVETQTGKIKYTFTATGAPLMGMSVADATRSMLNDLEKKFDRTVTNEFPLAGIILKVLNDKEMLIDVGKADGVAKGDLFLAIQRGESIVHPRTGKLIPGEKTTLAELEVIKVDEASSVVKVKKNTANVVFKMGMELEQKAKEAGFGEKLGDFFRR